MLFCVFVSMVACRSPTPDAQAQNPGPKEPAPSNMDTMTGPNATHEDAPEAAAPLCAATARALSERTFAGWKGLPDCTVNEIFPELDMSSTGGASLGSENVSADKKRVPLEGYYRVVVHARDNRLVMFQGRDPSIENAAVVALVAELGEPAGKERWWHGTLEMSETEWIYPERGITLFLNEDADSLYYIVVYAPTTLEDYMGRLRPKTKKRRHPKKKK